MINLFKPIKTTSEKLVTIQRKAGQLIFVTDKKRLYIDIPSAEGGRLMVSADSFIDVSCTDGKTLNFTKADGTTLSAAITVDNSLLANSTNAVQNKVVKAKIDEVLKLISDNTAAIETANNEIIKTNQALSTLETTKVANALADILVLQGQFVDLTAKDTALTTEDERLAELISQNAGNISKHEQAILSIEDSISDLEAEDARLDGLITKNTTNISKNTGNISTNTTDITNLKSKVSSAEGKISNLESADAGIKSRLDNVETTLTGITNVKTYVDDSVASAKTTAATDAQNKANEAEINAKSHATNLNTAMSTRVGAIEDVQDDHTGRLETIELFFAASATGGQEVVDTLKEIQDYLDSPGNSVADLLSSIQENKNRIEEVNSTLTDNITTLQAEDVTINASIGELEAEVATKATAKSVSDLTIVVSGVQEDVADLTSRVSVVEGVASGNTNSINTLRGDLTTLDGIVENQGQLLNTINNDYLKAADKNSLQNQINSLNSNTIKNVSLNGKTLTVTPTTGSAQVFTTQDTTYNPATTTSDGLMSAADKKKLNSLGESKKIIFISAQGYADLGTNIESNAIYFIN